MKIFVTGGAGYIGRALVPMLVEKGHKVTVIDRKFLNYDDVESEYRDMGCNFITGDIRYFDPNLLKGHDGVIDLAALSNDPSGDLDPIKTWDINYLGRVRVARLAKKLGVSRYVVSSSCSVYGFLDSIADENTPTNPLTAYAQANVAVEEDNTKIADRNFTATALRLATAFGYSKRMRLDIAINAMTVYAYKDRKVRLMRDGTQYRPFVHIKDISAALLQTLESEPETVSGKIYNIGSDKLNVKLSDLAETVRKAVGIESEIEWYGDPDTRSYRASFRRAKEELGFEAKISIEEGVREIVEKLESGELVDMPEMHTVNQYKKLLASKDKQNGHGLNIENLLL
ncbi:UDP-galactose-4-epimerase [Thermoplasmatales archaeon]|nr:UDP-galactose-4-epimerase [Thermoplasmatales archaeon]